MHPKSSATRSGTLVVFCGSVEGLWLPPSQCFELWPTSPKFRVEALSNSGQCLKGRVAIDYWPKVWIPRDLDTLVERGCLVLVGAEPLHTAGLFPVAA